jgi:hypothetical protein
LLQYSQQIQNHEIAPELCDSHALLITTPLIRCCSTTYQNFAA